MCTHPFLLGGGRRFNLQPNFQKKGGLIGPQLLEEVCWEKGVTLFRGGCNFHIKINQSEPFNDKKSLWTKIFFSVITKGSASPSWRTESNPSPHLFASTHSVPLFPTKSTLPSSGFTSTEVKKHLHTPTKASSLHSQPYRRLPVCRPF